MEQLATRLDDDKSLLVQLMTIYYMIGWMIDLLKFVR
jgi:hypothetical protein